MPRTRIPLRLAMFLALLALPAPAESSGKTLVLPLRTIGISDTISFVSHNLLVGSLGDLGVDVTGPPNGETLGSSGPEACDAPNCAAELGRRHAADQVVYGSLSRLGAKIIARLNVVRLDEPAPYYRDQLTAESVEDLDKVMRRFAEGIAAGRPNSDRATVESVTQTETLTPARPATRSGLGLRAGFLFPTGNSFGGADRLTNLHAACKYEMRNYHFENFDRVGGDGANGVMVTFGTSR